MSIYYGLPLSTCPTQTPDRVPHDAGTHARVTKSKGIHPARSPEVETRRRHEIAGSFGALSDMLCTPTDLDRILHDDAYYQSIDKSLSIGSHKSSALLDLLADRASYMLDGRMTSTFWYGEEDRRAT